MKGAETYTVEMFTNPDKPSIASWTFDDQASARTFYEGMKRGCTAYAITVVLEKHRVQIDAFKMGNEDQDHRPLGKVNYQESANQFQQLHGTDDFDRLPITR